MTQPETQENNDQADQSSDQTSDSGMQDSQLLNKMALIFGGIMLAFLLFFLASNWLVKNTQHPPTSPPVDIKTIDNPTEWEKNVEDQLVDAHHKNDRLNQRINDLQFQIDQNATTLAMVATFFGALITVIVVFFAIKQDSMVRSVVDTAEKRLKSMSDHSQNYINKIKTEIDEKYQTLKQNFDDIIERYPLNKNINSSNYGDKVAKSDTSLPPLPPLTPDQRSAVETAKAKAIFDRTAIDWRALAIDHLHQKAYADAAAAFLQEQTRRTTDKKRGYAWLNAGNAYKDAKQHDSANITYQDLIDWGKDKSPEVQIVVSQAWFNMSAIYAQFKDPKDPESAITTLQALIDWGKDKKDPGVQEIIDMAKAVLADLQG